MCHATYREADGDLVTRTLECSGEIDVLFYEAERRLWYGRILVHVQPCLVSFAKMLDYVRRQRLDEPDEHSTRVF